jgi:hypothetical protein
LKTFRGEFVVSEIGFFAHSFIAIVIASSARSRIGSS